jgi:hypothetical protein
MKILKYIPVLIFVLVLAGCQEQAKKKHWQDVSFDELMPHGRAANTKDVIVGLSLFIFEVDSGKYLDVQSALGGQSDLQVDASANISLAANGMLCGNGDTQNWPRIARSLEDANATVLKRVTLFMTEGISEQIELTNFPQGTSVYYTADNKTSAAIGLPAGSVILDINTKSLIGLKQACRLEIKPIYETIKRKVEEKRIPSWQYAFDSIGSKSTIRPGQFVFLSPAVDDFATAEPRVFKNVGEMIFANRYDEERVKFCLIVCGLIKD